MLRRGLEPLRLLRQRILSPLCLPIPPPELDDLFFNFTVTSYHRWKSGSRIFLLFLPMTESLRNWRQRSASDASNLLYKSSSFCHLYSRGSPISRTILRKLSETRFKSVTSTKIGISEIENPALSLYSTPSGIGPSPIMARSEFFLPCLSLWSRKRAPCSRERKTPEYALLHEGLQGQDQSLWASSCVKSSQAAIRKAGTNLQTFAVLPSS